VLGRSELQWQNFEMWTKLMVKLKSFYAEVIFLPVTSTAKAPLTCSLPDYNKASYLRDNMCLKAYGYV